MKRRRTVAIVGLLTGLGVTPAAFPCGISTHNEVSQRASWWFDGPGNPDYADYIQKYPEALQGGASFPDWGYALDNFGDAAEEAHWDPFLKAAADYIHRTYPPPWDRETQRTAVFLFAVAAHSVADISWHGLGVSEGMIDVMAAQDYHGDWGAAHSGADTGGDMVTAFELDQSYMTAPWYVPTDDMVSIYHEMGYDEVTAEPIIAANFLLFLGGHAEKYLGQLAYPLYARQSTVLTDQMQDYFAGGLDDMSTFSSWKWLDMIDWMENGVAGSSRTFDDWYEHDNENEAAINLGLKMLADGRFEVKVEKTARGVLFRMVDPRHPERGRVDDSRADPVGGAVEARTAPPGGLRSDAGRTCTDGSEVVGSRRPPALAGGRPGAGGASSLQFDPAISFTLSAPYAHLGTSVVSGDFNHDGLDDLAMGAPGYGIPGQPQRGQVHVAYGRRDLSGQVLELSGGGAGLTLSNADDYGRFGWSLAVLDFNADGLDDLAVSAPTLGARSLQYRGRVFVYFGRSTGLSTSPNVTITTTADYTNLGHTLASGDANGDGHRDLLIGTPFARAGGTQRGLAAIFLSSSARTSGLALDVNQADWLAYGEHDYDWFGMHLEVAPLRDRGTMLLVGAPSYNEGELQSVGRLYGFDLTGIGQGPFGTPMADFTITGLDQFDQTGQRFAVGDPVGGGAPLLVLASPTREESPWVETGEVMLARIDDLYGDMTRDDVLPISTLRGSQHYERFGWEVAMADIDRDGIDELVVSAPWRRAEGGVESGAVYVWKGGQMPTGTVRNAEATAAGAIEGADLAGRFGSALAFPDFNGDGTRDLVASARQSSSAGSLSGTVTVLTTAGLARTPLARTQLARASMPPGRAVYRGGALRYSPTLSGRAPAPFRPGSDR